MSSRQVDVEDTLADERKEQPAFDLDCVVRDTGLDPDDRPEPRQVKGHHFAEVAGIGRVVRPRRAVTDVSCLREPPVEGLGATGSAAFAFNAAQTASRVF